MIAWTDWAHVITGTRGSWLPGDARGFRSRGHRVHSSGDYSRRPPPEEHRALREFSGAIAVAAIEFDVVERATVGEAMLAKLRSMNVACAALCVAPRHAHALIRVGPHDAIEIVGRAKQAASLALSRPEGGRLWGRSSHVVRVSSLDHGRAVKRYVLNHAQTGAWVFPSV